MNILKKHADRNYYDDTFPDFREKLERGRIGVAELRHWDLYGSRCVTCDESITRFKYRGERFDLVHVSGFWVIHQCPPNKLYEIGPEEGQPEPEPEIDAQERADIEQEMLSHQWPDDMADDPYNYPDVPYVVPEGFK